MYEITSLVHF